MFSGGHHQCVGMTSIARLGLRFFFRSSALLSISSAYLCAFHRHRADILFPKSLASFPPYLPYYRSYFWRLGTVASGLHALCRARSLDKIPMYSSFRSVVFSECVLANTLK